MDNLFNDDDLGDLLAEFQNEDNKVETEHDVEMEASHRRYQEIIKKHQEEE